MQIDKNQEPAKIRAKPSGRFRSKKDMEARRQRAHTLDIKQIKKLSSVGMPIESIAHRIGVSPDWLWEQKNRDYDIERAIIEGQYEFEEGLRTTQARLALSGHPGMLIWLGKQYLGQSDKQESKSETTVNVVLNNAIKELRDLSSEDLAAMKAIVESRQKPITIENHQEAGE